MMKYLWIPIAILLYYYQQYTKPSITQLIDTYYERPLHDVIFNIPISLYTDELSFPDLIPATDIQLRAELSKIQDDESVNFKFDLKYGINATDNSHLIIFKLRDVELLYNIPTERVSEFLFKESTVFSNDFPYFLTQTIIHQLFRDELERFKWDKFDDKDGLKFINDDTPTRENITLNFNPCPGVDLPLLQSQFTDLQDLYRVKFINTGKEEIGDGVYNINVVQQNNVSGIAVIDNSIHVSLNADEEIVISQLAFDIKEQLFNMLNFIENPLIIPMKIDMELRYQTVKNLLQFIAQLHERRTQFTDGQIIQLFKLRQEILRILRDEYDWVELFKLSKQLVYSVESR